MFHVDGILCSLKGAGARLFLISFAETEGAGFADTDGEKPIE